MHSPDAALPPPGTTAPADDEAALATWLGAIADHDDRALTALYDASVARVWSFVRCLVRGDAIAEAVVEDTYYQVWCEAARFDPAQGAPSSWLLALARRCAIDAMRREPAATAGSAAADDELLDFARHRADLHQALLLLDAEPRRMVSMAFLHGLSHEEIARQTRQPPGTVAAQIRRAAEVLRGALGSPGPAAPAT